MSFRRKIAYEVSDEFVWSMWCIVLGRVCRRSIVLSVDKFIIFTVVWFITSDRMYCVMAIHIIWTNLHWRIGFLKHKNVIQCEGSYHFYAYHFFSLLNNGAFIFNLSDWNKSKQHKTPNMASSRNRKSKTKTKAIIKKTI